MTYNIKSLVERLRKAVELYDTLMSTVTGCTDGGCMIRAPQGMHTNGGCRCHRDSMKTQRVLYSAKQLREAIDIDAIERAATPVADSAMAKDAERYRKWISYSGFTKEHTDATLDAISINAHAAIAASEPKNTGN